MDSRDQEVVGVVDERVVTELHPLGPLRDEADTRLVHAACWLRRRHSPEKSKPRDRRRVQLPLFGPSGNALT
ncbi:hypothetical protein GMSM_30900 [Geomonas sp. Red276]